MRKILVGVALIALVACGKKAGDGDTVDSGSGVLPPDACVGLQCQVVNCTAVGKPPTTISGIVYAPNGTLPLVDVDVYVPNTDPGPFGSAVSCTHCADELPGDPVVQTSTSETGGPNGGVGFTLMNVPAGDKIPVVVTIGKWRRQLVIPTVAQCGTTMLDATDTTLPKSATDMTPNTKSVDLPNIAISTGQADALECLVRKLGIADTEISTDGQAGHIHLWSDESANGGTGISQFKSGFPGGNGTFANSENLWGSGGDPGKLGNYDIVILSCEGAQHEETKPQAAMDHLKAYADAGGRVFMSHWHNIWIEGNTQQGNNHVAPTEAPAIWPTIAVFNDSETTLPDNTNDLDRPHRQPERAVVRGVDVRSDGQGLDDAGSSRDRGRHRQEHVHVGRRDQGRAVGLGACAQHHDAADVPVRDAERSRRGLALRQGRVLGHARVG